MPSGRTEAVILLTAWPEFQELPAIYWTAHSLIRRSSSTAGVRSIGNEMSRYEGIGLGASSAQRRVQLRSMSGMETRGGRVCHDL